LGLGLRFTYSLDFFSGIQLVRCILLLPVIYIPPGVATFNSRRLLYNPSYTANMRSQLFSLLFLTVFTTYVLAAPAPQPPKPIQKRSFKVKRVVNEKFRGYHGPTQLYKAYSKYGMFIPESLHEIVNSNRAQRQGHGGHRNKNGTAGVTAKLNTTASALALGVGRVTATPVQPNDLEYIAPIKIGGQTLNMNFDSGSSDLWVFNTQLSETAQTGHQVYDPTKSSTFQFLTGETFSITYGDGSGAKGNVGMDTVDIGGATFTSQAIEMATAVSNSFIQDTNSNGLVGLGFSKLNTVKPTQQKTFFDNVLPSLPEPVFVADLRQDEVGSYEFGAIDSTRFQGELTWAPVDTASGFWQFSSSKFAIGGGNTLNAIGGTAIADTGTTLMLVNPAVVNAYWGQVGGAVNDAKQGGIVFPCDAVLPDLEVDVGGVYMAKIEGKFMNFAKVDAAGTSKSSSSGFIGFRGAGLEQRLIFLQHALAAFSKSREIFRSMAISFSRARSSCLMEGITHWEWRRMREGTRG
jgi:hypothetical protein